MPVIVGTTAPRTLGDLKTRIADELARADLSAQIALAINDAIEEASTHRFWFMETIGLTIPVIAGQASYQSADFSSLAEIDRLALIVSGQRYTLRETSDDDLDLLNDGTAPRGQPYAYSRYAEGLRVYPTPTQSYTVMIDGVSKGVPLAADTDSNMWTDTAKGERYVRALAKRNLYADVIQNPDKAIAQDQLAQRYRQEMEAQTGIRASTNEICTYA